MPGPRTGRDQSPRVSPVPPALSKIPLSALLLQSGTSYIRSIQNAIASPIALALNTWTNVGAPIILTPSRLSYIMVWAYLSGAHSVSTTIFGRLLFNGGNGENAGLGIASRDDALGAHLVAFFDTFIQAVSGAVSIQAQINADNAGNYALAATKSNQLSLFALAIPIA